MSEAEYIVVSGKAPAGLPGGHRQPLREIDVALAQQIKLSDEGVHPEGQLLHHGPTTYREKGTSTTPVSCGGQTLKL